MERNYYLMVVTFFEINLLGFLIISINVLSTNSLYSGKKINETMGGDLIQTELKNCDKFKQNNILWPILLTSHMDKYIEGMKSFELKVSKKFVKSWDHVKVNISGVSYVVLVESIPTATGLVAEGKVIPINSNGHYKQGLKKFLSLGESIPHL